MVRVTQRRHARLVCIPSWDREFAGMVAGMAADGAMMSTGELEDVLRPLYRRSASTSAK